MKRPLYFLTILVVFTFIFTNVLALNAATPESCGNESAKAQSVVKDVNGENDKDSDVDTEGTGNSTGEIIFMLVIFIGSLLILAEAVVSTIRKSNRKKENIDASMDERRR